MCYHVLACVFLRCHVLSCHLSLSTSLEGPNQVEQQIQIAGSLKCTLYRWNIGHDFGWNKSQQYRYYVLLANMLVSLLMHYRISATLMADLPHKNTFK